MPSGITRVRPRSNDTSDRIESSSTAITEVIPRDTGLNTERYIIFTNGRPLPTTTEAVIENLDIPFEILALANHAIDYQHSETYETANYLARRND